MIIFIKYKKISSHWLTNSFVSGAFGRIGNVCSITFELKCKLSNSPTDGWASTVFFVFFLVFFTKYIQKKIFYSNIFNMKILLLDINGLISVGDVSLTIDCFCGSNDDSVGCKNFESGWMSNWTFDDQTAES